MCFWHYHVLLCSVWLFASCNEEYRHDSSLLCIVNSLSVRLMCSTQNWLIKSWTGSCFSSVWRLHFLRRCRCWSRCIHLLQKPLCELFVTSAPHMRVLGFYHFDWCDGVRDEVFLEIEEFIMGFAHLIIGLLCVVAGIESNACEFLLPLISVGIWFNWLNGKVW